MYLEELNLFNRTLSQQTWLLVAVFSSDNSWQFDISPIEKQGSSVKIWQTLTLSYINEQWRSFSHGINEDLTVSTPNVPVKQWPLLGGECWVKHIDIQANQLVINLVVNGEYISFICSRSGTLVQK
ncbi:hypothetical protein [Vibrio sp. MA40-2]|uniref:hypothetical protein n=1 Tax=Vibrio sp. MA40-2 TaxID=3391828 RepID=UPI0039A50C6A